MLLTLESFLSLPLPLTLGVDRPLWWRWQSFDVDGALVAYVAVSPNVSPSNRNYDENKFSPRNNPHFLHNSRTKRAQMCSGYIIIYCHSFCSMCFASRKSRLLGVHCQTLVTVPEFEANLKISQGFPLSIWKYLWQKKQWIQEGIWVELDGVKS